MDNSRINWLRDRMLSCYPALMGLILMTISIACTEVIDQNQPPVAIAGEDQKLEFKGSRVTVTLDGSESFDPDGKIVEYIWYNTGVCPQERYVFKEDPDWSGQILDWTNVKKFKGDPDNKRKPVGELGQGEYRYTLWVRDNDGWDDEISQTIDIFLAHFDTAPLSARPEPGFGRSSSRSEKTRLENI